MGVWNESHKGSQQFDKAQWENKLHMWKGFSNLRLKWLWKGIWQIKEEFARVFMFFLINFPKHLALREKIGSSNYIININYLDEHAVLRIYVHKNHDDKHGIELMRANHRKYVCSTGGVCWFILLSLIKRIWLKIHSKLKKIREIREFRDTNWRSWWRWTWVGHPFACMLVQCGVLFSWVPVHHFSPGEAMALPHTCFVPRCCFKR